MAFNRWADWDYDVFIPAPSAAPTRHPAPRHALCLIGLIGLFRVHPTEFSLPAPARSPPDHPRYSLTKRFAPYTHAVWVFCHRPDGRLGRHDGDLHSPLPGCCGGGLVLVFGFDLITRPGRPSSTSRPAFILSRGPWRGAALRLARLLHFLTWLILLAFGWLRCFRCHIGSPWD